MKYDIVLTGGHVIDPARGTDRVTSVALANQRIAAVGDDIDPRDATRVLPVAGKFVSPGWFDMHVHAYSYLSFSDPDTIGVLQGVPTVLDAGGGGAWTYEDCRRYWEGHCKTEIYAFVMFNAAGIYLGQEDILSVEANRKLEVPLDDWIEVVGRNRDRVRMVKTAALTSLGFTPIRAAQVIAESVGLPIYVHIGDIRGRLARGPMLIRDVLDSLRPGDVVTHIYTGNYGGLLDDRGLLYPEVRAAQRRGVLFDVGYGGVNFSFESYDRLMAQDLVTDVISSDLQGVNITGPTHSLANVMSVFLNNGLGLREVIERVAINPARAQRLDDRLGSLTPGHPARVTVFELQEGEHTFRDTMGKIRIGSTRIVPRFCITGEEVVDCDLHAGLAPTNWTFMPSAAPPPPARLDPEDREFVRALAETLAPVDWGDGHALHEAFKRRVGVSGIAERKATNAVYTLLLENPVCVPVGWLLNGFDRGMVLERLTGAGGARLA
jgi:dihydroorotase